MNVILIVGVILFVGFIFGELAKLVKLPKVTGYIIAGIVLNPDIFHIVPQGFTAHTDFVTNIALSFITFSVGGTLLGSKLKRLGKTILYITIFEAEFAFFTVALGFLCLAHFFIHIPEASSLSTLIPLSMLIAALASPTDPSATLAVIHEYKAKGEVSSTIMGVAALDDVLGIINYSFAVVIAGAVIMHQDINILIFLKRSLIVICGAVGLGIAFGIIFNYIFLFVKKETEGVFIVLIFGLLAICFGLATVLGVDELLATMTMGIVVVNFNRQRDKIFKMLERYTEELIFVLFFTLSAMHLELSVLYSSFVLVLLFFVFRTLGKVIGTTAGAFLAKASAPVKKFTVGGLIPQGGIVVGLALMMRQNPAFRDISDIIINVIIGATIVHELIGPLAAKTALQKAGELRQ